VGGEVDATGRHRLPGPAEEALMVGTRPVQDHHLRGFLPDIAAAASGLEIFNVLKDVCRLDDGEADRAAERIVISILAAAFPAEPLR
jgi:hypothetical protein